MSSILAAVNAQYERTQNTASGNVNFPSNEERLKKYFNTILPKGVRSGERRIRILPTTDGSSPFVEVYYHEVRVDGKWLKLYDPKQEGKTSPLNEVHDALRATGIETDAVLARQYRARKFFIVKIIDRDNEEDGVKFWRFKYNSKSEGILDKIFPIFKNKGDITDPVNGRDLIISIGLSKANNGNEYSSVNSVIPDDISPLHENKEIAKEWIEDELAWTDVYSKKPVEYLEIVAAGDTPKWDNNLKRWYSEEQSNEEASESLSNSVSEPKTNNVPETEQTSNESTDEPDVDDEEEDDLPF